MRIGIPDGRAAGETLVAATPKTTAQLIALGYEVIVEAGAGAAAKFPDEAYARGGRDDRLAPTRSGPPTSCCKVNEPTPGRDRPAAPRARP